MTDHKDIHDAIHAVYNDVGYVKKERSANLNYTFAGESAFIEKLRPAMIEHGVTVSVDKMDSLNQEAYTTKNGAPMMRSTVHGVVKFQHVGGTSILVESYGEGSDSGDKSVNKAMTDMYKYALRQTFMIETGDDPDKDVSQERNNNYKSPEPKPAVKDEKPAKGYFGNPIMSYEEACNITGSDGAKYGNCTNADLEGKKIGILKALKKSDVDATTQGQYQTKLEAIKVLLAVPEPERMKRNGQMELA